MAKKQHRRPAGHQPASTTAARVVSLAGGTFAWVIVDGKNHHVKVDSAAFDELVAGLDEAKRGEVVAEVAARAEDSPGGGFAAQLQRLEQQLSEVA